MVAKRERARRDPCPAAPSTPIEPPPPHAIPPLLLGEDFRRFFVAARALVARKVGRQPGAMIPMWDEAARRLAEEMGKPSPLRDDRLISECLQKLLTIMERGEAAKDPVVKDPRDVLNQFDQIKAILTHCKKLRRKAGRKTTILYEPFRLDGSSREQKPPILVRVDNPELYHLALAEVFGPGYFPLYVLPVCVYHWDKPAQGAYAVLAQKIGCSPDYLTRLISKHRRHLSKKVKLAPER